MPDAKRKLSGNDWMRAAKTYFADYAGYIERQKPTIIAHFDLFAKNNRKQVGTVFRKGE